MDTSSRRQGLLKILEQANNPIIGAELAREFDVSRQVIVQDIALLRARGYDIIATSQGYVLNQQDDNQLVTTTIACRHDGQHVREELMTMVSFGARVVDVIVEHPLYGELRGLLMIQSPADVENFMQNYTGENATLLSALTDGVHLHTIKALNNQVISRLKQDLRDKGFLLTDPDQ